MGRFGAPAEPGVGAVDDGGGGNELFLGGGGTATVSSPGISPSEVGLRDGAGFAWSFAWSLAWSFAWSFADPFAEPSMLPRSTFISSRESVLVSSST
jgi:hypothetical protein